MKKLIVTLAIICSLPFVKGWGWASAQILEGGPQHSLYISNAYGAVACGINPDGTLGDGTNNNRNCFVQVSPFPFTNVTKVSAGGSSLGGGHSLFLKNDGTVWACGSNTTGQLGDGTTTKR